MLVSHKKKFIFIKSKKTASTSVEVYFERYCVPDNRWEPTHYRDQLVSDAGIVGHRGPNMKSGTEFYNHMPASELQAKLSSNIWQDYFKFTIIRNPFDKMISAFYHFEKSRNPEKYLEHTESDIILFRRWVESGAKVLDKQIYLSNGQETLDFYIRYENLLEDIQFVCEKINVPYQPESLQNFKRQFRDRSFAVVDFYDQQTHDIITSDYEFEIEKFGYAL